MVLFSIFNNFEELYGWVLFPLIIFFARICAPSIGFTLIGGEGWNGKAKIIFKES